MNSERPPDASSVAGLVLAAGKSSRMGRDKALLPFRGSTFLEAILGVLHGAGLVRIAVVLGHHAGLIERSADLSGVEVVYNPDYEQGQTSSLQAGLRALERPDLEAVLLALVDHPAISEETVQTLIAEFLESHAPVVIPTHEGRRGHPLIIARKLFEPLLDLSLDQGANSIVRDYRESTLFVEVEDPGILLDVDEPESLAALGQ